MSQLSFAQNSNNQVNVWQGGVNFGTFQSNNSEVEIEQLASSGTIDSQVDVQQVDDGQYAKITQTNVINSHVNLAQGEGSDNTIDVTQIDANELFFQARQFGSENEVSAGQTGSDNFSVTAQSGARNYAIVSQGGEFNHTIGYNFLSQSTHDFLDVTGKFKGTHDPGGTGHYTDGVIQIGNDNLASLSQLGATNGAFLYQEGDMNSGSVLQSGSFNQAFNLQRGADNVSNITQDGTTSSTANTLQGASTDGASGNTILATQSEGTNLYIGARQDGSENMATITQSNNDNRVFTAQNGEGNNITATQSGENNHTKAYADLGTLHLAFLDQHGSVVPKFKGDHQFDGNALYTDGIIQIGNGNEVKLLQSGDDNGAFLYQENDNNSIDLTQAGIGDMSCIMQRGNENSALVKQ